MLYRFEWTKNLVKESCAEDKMRNVHLIKNDSVL